MLLTLGKDGRIALHLFLLELCSIMKQSHNSGSAGALWVSTINVVQHAFWEYSFPDPK